MLADTDIIQTNQGAFEGTSGNATLPVGTTAGSMLLLFIGSSGIISTPSGFTGVSQSPVSVAGCRLFTKVAGAAETSWAILSGSSAAIGWYIEEWPAGTIDPDFPVDAVPAGAPQAGGAGGTTAASNTTPASTTYDGVAYALHAGYLSADTVPTTFSGHTGGFAEVAEVGSVGAVKSLGLSVSRRPASSLGTFQSTATADKTVTNWGAAVIVLTAVGAKREPNISYFWSFPDELIGVTGLATGLANFRYWDTQAGSPAITADGLQIATTAAAETVTSRNIAVLGAGLPKAALTRVKLRFDSALPGADAELARVASASDGTVVLRYVSASQKLGLKIGTGAEQLSDAVVAADTVYAVDLRLVGTTTAYTCDWQVDYGAGLVVQTPATFTASGTLGAWTLQLGSPAAATMTVTYASAVCSVTPGHYPLGEHSFVFLRVDPAGTPTVSGTSSSFRRFTANGTIDGAFDAAAIRDALDEWPPTVGASADGLAVVTAHATDYIELPMQTYDVSGTGSVRAVRVLLPMWAASATAATCKVAAWDGSVSTQLFAEQDPGADNADPPAWICPMWRPTGGWSQAKLDAAAVRFGSNDATPDIGPHAVGMEVCVQAAQSQGLFGDPATGDVAVTAARDPLSDGILGLHITAPQGRGTSLTYEVSGSPTTVNVAAGGTLDQVVDAPDGPTVNRVELHPDPEGVADT